MRDVGVTVVDSNEVIVHWSSVVEPNGVISHYHIQLTRHDNMDITILVTSSLHASLTRLGE